MNMKSLQLKMNKENSLNKTYLKLNGFPDRINIEGKWTNVWINPNTHEWKPRK